MNDYFITTRLSFLTRLTMIFLFISYSLVRLTGQLNHSVPLNLHRNRYIYTYIVARIGLKKFPTLEE